jgi:diguanylate cyclase (GGDEF)-like protein
MTPQGIELDSNLITILDSLDALVYVADMQTYDVLYMNRYGQKIWGDKTGRKCWEIMQSAQTGPCSFCTNHCLVGADGEPGEPHVWEIENTVNQRWYQCRDQTIRWSDGRIVRLEVATDITESKATREALKLAKQQAENLAHTDELTGLYNRRAFFIFGEQALNQAIRAKQSVSLVMFDVDYFKQINDTHGHAVGDQVLRVIAQTIRPLIREADILARIGGEEFVVLMPGADWAAAKQLAERLRSAISQEQVELADATIHFTASFGIIGSEDGSMPLEKLLSSADQGMYAAKSGGRNRIVEADEPEMRYRA